MTGPQGTFVVPQLPSGTYAITAELTGFKKAAKSNVILPIASKVNAGDFVLEIGNLTEVVSVEADLGRMQMQTESGERSDLVTNRQLRDIALNGRNIADLMKLVPGVIAGGTITTSTVTNVVGGFNINGTRSLQHEYTVDGVTNLNLGQQHRRARLGEPRRARGSQGPHLELPGRVRQGRRRLHRPDDARRHEPIPRRAAVLRPQREP